jgi:excinuclease UvrABC nuclease subunit
LVSADGCLQNLNNYQWVSGCYIIFNKSEHDKIYVGQSKNLALRVPQHFSNEGHGNKRIYNDYRGGDKFEIKIIP